MKLKEYKEKYHYAPFSKQQFINGALKVEDDDELVRKARHLERAEREFDEALQERDIFYG